MPIPDPNFVASVPLQYYFVNKDDGTPLSSGVVTFYSDPEFSIKKSVYQLTTEPDGEILFAALPNPMILSGIGTFVDDTGNNVVPYYFPWDGTPGSDDPGDEELYFVTVYSSQGVFQFSLTEWPPNTLGGGGSRNEAPLTANQLTNPQFSVIGFTPNPGTGSLSISVSGIGTINTVAPGWSLVTSGTGTVVLSQVSITENIPTESSSALNITTSGSLTQVKLVQRLTSDPRILGNPTSVSAASFVSGYLVARSSVSTSATVTMTYEPSNGVVTTILTGNTTNTHNFTPLSDTAELDTPYSTDGSTGYVDIGIYISPQSNVDITSIQLVGVTDSTDIPQYIQKSTQLQLSDLSWYYNPQWSFKPIKSYLTGWDFPLNPAQFGEVQGASSIGANKSKYVWDQTILFQTVNNTLSVGRESFIDSIVVTATSGASSFALIQYIPGIVARRMFANRFSVNVQGDVNSGTLLGSVSVWWTTGGALPDMNSPNFNSLVSAITNSFPTCGNAAGGQPWTQVSRGSNGTAFFTLSTDRTANFPFSGWDATDSGAPETATYAAIVLGFDTLANGLGAVINSTSLVPGDIATIPSPQTLNEVLEECQYYYESSYDYGVVPGTATGTSAVFESQNVGSSGGSLISLYPSMFDIDLKQPKHAAPTITFYSTTGASGNVVGMIQSGGLTPVTANIAISNWALLSTGTKVITYRGNSAVSVMDTAGTLDYSSNAGIRYYYTADSRLGIV